MRSYRELWLWLGAAFLALFAAFIAIGLAYFTKEQNFSFYTSWEAWASIAAFILGFACFACAILGTPFPPWTKQKFPNIFVEIYGGSDVHTKHMFPNGITSSAHLRAYRVRITNLESEQNASLTIGLFLKLVPGSRGRIGETSAPIPNWPLDATLGLDTIKMPIILAPGTTVGGDLVYEMTHVDLMSGTILANPLRKRFRIDDHISGQQKDVITEADLGSFGRDDMFASHRGVEILGPEYETKTEETGDAAEESGSSDHANEPPNPPMAPARTEG
jgi:hypothetical protein